MLVPVSLLAALAALYRPTTAVPSVSEDDMNSMLSGSGVDLAMKAQPMWFFGQAMNQPPAYPTSALDENDASRQHAASDLCQFPNAGCDCRQPGVEHGNPGPSFPVYFSTKKCGDDEVRVVYNLFYEKDGFSDSGTKSADDLSQDNIFGHFYDWERVIVLWARSDGQWKPSKLMMSAHSGYNTKNWDKIQNTFDGADSGLARGGDNGKKNRDHPKVYVGWAKHAQFDTRNTGWNDLLSQMTGNEFRSQDWWYFPVEGDYIRADSDSDIGKQLGSFNWGKASSNPLKVHEGLCEED